MSSRKNYIATFYQNKQLGSQHFGQIQKDSATVRKQ